MLRVISICDYEYDEIIGIFDIPEDLNLDTILKELLSSINLQPLPRTRNEEYHQISSTNEAKKRDLIKNLIGINLEEYPIDAHIIKAWLISQGFKEIPFTESDF